MASHNERKKFLCSLVVTVTEEFSKRPPRIVRLDIQEVSAARMVERIKELVMARLKGE